MRILSLALSLTVGSSAFAEIPNLINYQGRLVDGVGNPIIGKRDFNLDVYDSQTGGVLVYQETLPDVELDEDGAYSFQFGAGESRTDNSVLVATGDGETTFFQKVFERTPVGEITVTDGTNTFKTGDVPTGEEPFTFTYTASLNRLNLACNEPPAAGVGFTATFRYAEPGISGALSSSAEQWLELTIGGEKQAPRQRIVAVPFALLSERSNEASALSKRERQFVLGLFYRKDTAERPVLLDMGMQSNVGDGIITSLNPQSGMQKIKRVELRAVNASPSSPTTLNFSISKRGGDGRGFSEAIQLDVGEEIDIKLVVDLDLDFSDGYYIIEFQNTGNGFARVSPVTLVVEDWGKRD